MPAFRYFRIRKNSVIKIITHWKICLDLHRKLKFMEDAKLYFEERGEQLLRARGMTKARFARQMGIHRQNVNQLFTTKNVVVLREAARVLEVPFELLISYVDDPLKDHVKVAADYKVPEYVRITLPYVGFEELFRVECGGDVIDDPYEVRKLAMYNQEDEQFDFTVNLKTGSLNHWIYAVDFRIQAKMEDRGTYTLMDEDMAPIVQMSGCVPRGLIPQSSDCDIDSVDFIIDEDGVITDWPLEPDLSMFSVEGIIPDDFGIGKWSLASRILCDIYNANLSDRQLNWIADMIRR